MPVNEKLFTVRLLSLFLLYVLECLVEERNEPQICPFAVDKLLDVDNLVPSFVHCQHEHKLPNIVPLFLGKGVVVFELFIELRLAL